MTAFSDYLESGLLHHIFRNQSFPKPTNIAIALCSGVPIDSDTGRSQYVNNGTLPELPSGTSTGASTGYTRYNLGDPATLGNSAWTYSINDHNAGSGLIKNSSTILFPTALTDWGWVSGIAIVDSGEYGVGNMLMYAQLNNPRIIYQGDSVKFDLATLQIKLK